MIELINNGKTVTVSDSIDGTCKVISLVKGLTLKPREIFNISTGLTIKCSSNMDECWIWSDPIFDKDGNEVDFSDNIGILTHRITKENGDYQVNLFGGYMGDEEVKLPKGAEIARIYLSLINRNNINTDELKGNILYEEDGVVVRTSTDFYGQYELVIEPDGSRYLKVHLPA